MRKIILSACFCSLGTFAFANETSSADKPADPITKTQFQSIQRAMFNKADANYDGKVTKDEILLLKWEKNKPKYKTAFAKLDINNNGFLDYDEVKTKHEELTRNKVERDNGYKERFLKNYDKDGNGTITPKEIDDYYAKKAKKAEASTENNAKKDFQTKDTDESGLITLDEYLKSKSRVGASRHPRKGQENQFLTRDSNRDGTITRSENELFVTHFFDELDKNKDAKISDPEQSNKAYTLSQNFNAGLLFLGSRKSISSNDNSSN